MRRVFFCAFWILISIVKQTPANKRYGIFSTSVCCVMWLIRFRPGNLVCAMRNYCPALVSTLSVIFFVLLLYFFARFIFMPSFFKSWSTFLLQKRDRDLAGIFYVVRRTGVQAAHPSGVRDCSPGPHSRFLTFQTLTLSCTVMLEWGVGPSPQILTMFGISGFS